MLRPWLARWRNSHATLASASALPPMPALWSRASSPPMPSARRPSPSMTHSGQASVVLGAHHGDDAVMRRDGRAPADAHELSSVDHEAAGDALPLGLPAEGAHQPLHGALRDADEERGAAQPFAHGGDQVGHADGL